MKKIKFRAWLKTKMYYQDKNTASCMNGLERFTQIVGSEEGYTPIIMQYTGLKDKNGEEIYESDILKLSDGIFEVKYVEIIAGFYAGKSFDKRMEFEGTLNREIIGNIFENPNVLNK